MPSNTLGLTTANPSGLSRKDRCTCHHTGRVSSGTWGLPLGDYSGMATVAGGITQHPFRPALKSCPASRTYYDRKRTEGKTHIQAMLALARRRLNVLWAMLRDGTTYTPVPATASPMAA